MYAGEEKNCRYNDVFARSTFAHRKRAIKHIFQNRITATKQTPQPVCQWQSGADCKTHIRF